MSQWITQNREQVSGSSLYLNEHRDGCVQGSGCASSLGYSRVCLLGRLFPYPQAELMQMPLVECQTVFFFLLMSMNISRGFNVRTHKHRFHFPYDSNMHHSE